jgi:Ca-activated chloride channel homolog
MGESRYYSSKALKEYEAGDYAKAEELYGKAAEKKPDSPEIQYNLGSTLLKAGKLSKSVESLESVYDEKRPELNAAARYNSGLAHHTLARKALEAVGNNAAPTPAPQGTGGADAGRETAIKELESAVADYKTSLLANPEDTDVKFNYELAQRELAQLRQIQQQQQQQQNQDNKDKKQEEKKDDQQKQDQQKQDQQKNDQQQNKEQKENKEQQPQPQNQDQKDKEQEQKEQQDKDQKNQDKDQKDKKDQKDQKDKKDQKDQKDQQQKGKDGQDSGSSQDKQQIGEMSQQDLDRLLNSLPEENKQALQRFLNAKFKSRGDMERDW